jgi:DNA-binding response OmpR family regulator
MPKALIIDDDASLTTMVRRFLEGAGLDVETALSGAGGLQKAVSMRPDVAIVDIMMPDMDGYEVCRRLRKDPRTARAAIVVLTARGQLIDKQVALRAGADVHMTKPFNGKALVGEIQQLLAERATTEEPLGYQVLVLRLQAGVGATTVSVNLALCLARDEGRLAIVADLVLQGGQIESRLGLPLVESWQDAAERDEDGLVRHLVRHESGLFALPTPASNGELATPVRVAQVLQRLREWHDYVVVDTPFNLGPLAPVLLQSSPLVLLLVTSESAILQAARASLTTIERMGGRALQIWPVLRLAGDEEKSAQQRAEDALGLPVISLLPSAPEACAQAVAACRPMVLSYPDSSLAGAFRDLAQEIVRNARRQPLRRIPR